jgi:hypothetical protein
MKPFKQKIALYGLLASGMIPSWFKRVVLPSLLLLVPLLVPGPVAGQERKPDLTVSSFALTGRVSAANKFSDGVKSYRGYIFVPVEFTVVNSGAAVAGPFKIAVKCRLSRATVRPVDFLPGTVSQDQVGSAKSSASALPPAFEDWVKSQHGVPLSVSDPLPAGGKLTASGTLAVPVGSVLTDVDLWIVTDSDNQVAESNENNNESKVLIVKVPVSP